MPSTSGELQVTCDESGNDGEQLMQGTGAVFALGSHDLGESEADELMAWLHEETGTPASNELKFKRLTRRDSGDLLAELFDSKLPDRASAYPVEKTYFVVGKVIDLLIEELAHAGGIDLHARGTARRMALSFYTEGGRALGAAEWTGLLQTFNSLMRVNSRKSAKATVSDFFEKVEDLRWRSRRKNVTTVLDLIRQARPHAEEFQRGLTSTVIPALDPLPPSLAQTARFWHSKSGSPIRIRHDVSPVLTSQTVDAIVNGLNNPGEFAKYAPSMPLLAIEQYVSASDSRVQVADLIAGFAAKVAAEALAGVQNPAEVELLRPYVNPEGLWGNERSWRVLVDGTP